jgi:2-polyprenyl-3-methyl-5-hydroxy-6-metoxy-1,4-benzoquinol methylase
MDEYIKFYSDTHDLDITETKKVFQKSFDVFGSRGWNGGEFGKFTDMMSGAMQWKYLTKEKNGSFISKDNIDYIKCYDYMQDLDLMRMLSYSFSLNHLAMQANVKIFVENLISKYENDTDLNQIVLVDYGCGLAYWTIAICEELIKSNIPVKLILIDIFRQSFVEFLEYLCQKRKIDYEFRPVIHNKLIPEIPECDYVHLMAVLEHTSEPTKIIKTIVDNIRNGGIIFGTFYDDPFDDFQHISMDLSKARDVLEKNKNYKIENLGPYWNSDTTIYQVFKNNNI